jgi:uncharacterized membrane protein YqaE (UPF0057 family)
VQRRLGCALPTIGADLRRSRCVCPSISLLCNPLPSHSHVGVDIIINILLCIFFFLPVSGVGAIAVLRERTSERGTIVLPAQRTHLDVAINPLPPFSPFARFVSFTHV